MKKHTHLIPGFPKMLHGGDYNPDQWMNYPGTVDRDFELTGKARCNTFSVGIFSWVRIGKKSASPFYAISLEAGKKEKQIRHLPAVFRKPRPMKPFYGS